MACVLQAVGVYETERILSLTFQIIGYVVAGALICAFVVLIATGLYKFIRIVSRTQAQQDLSKVYVLV